MVQDASGRVAQPSFSSSQELLEQSLAIDFPSRKETFFIQKNECNQTGWQNLFEISWMRGSV